MPAKNKATTRKGSSSSKAKQKVGKAMHEFKHGQLKSGGRRKVKNPKQAIAIGLSEARQAGADIPTKKGTSRKSAPRKTSRKSSRRPARQAPRTGI